ncbi:MAG: M1 family metallopeptidase [Hyphomonadaceae bacterium]|nr:M1 family metallopeptidase [Hyphomonadaceae bacterium]
MRIKILIALAVLFLTVPAAPALAQRQWLEGGPTPLRYEIAIVPNAEAGTFTGETRIAIRADAPAARVTMNALDLDIASATIDGQAARIALNAEAQTLTLTPRRALAPGAHDIRVVYSGTIYDDAYGLFRVSYETDGRSQTMLSTMAEPGDARRIAPMWDQPDKRAVFSITVTAPAGETAYSNMPAAETTRLPGGATRMRFQDTPSMSSYLMFFAVGDLERISTNVDGVDVGIVARRGAAEHGRYALEETANVLRYYTEYFGIPYPLPKLDFIATPGAGSFGAMEHWGAILAFDQYVLLDENASEADRQEVFDTVAHEVAHQWFGNLVTMRWWDDLWLNEGFAQWMAAKAMDRFHPDWQPWLAQSASGTAAAMSLDARAGTHPVVQEVNTLQEANLAFDTITYNKGLAVIRMIEAYVGEEDFRDGVRAYLNAHLYGNTESNDLWRAVQAASGQPVLDIALSFTTQPGYPVLQPVASACTRSLSQDHIRITQRRFAFDDASRTGELWTIPVVTQILGEGPQRDVLAASAQTSIDAPACSTFLMNAGQSGYFRVLYDAGNFEALEQRFARLGATDQLGLLLDYWAFGQSGDASFARYLDLAARIPANADPLIVEDFAASLSALVDYQRGRAGEAATRAFARERLAPFFARVGLSPRPGEASNETLLRATLISTLGGMQDEAIVTEARRRFESGDPALLPGDVRGAVLSVYGESADAVHYERLVALAQSANDFLEQRRYWLALASAQDEALARRTLDLVHGETIPRQLRFVVLNAVAAQHPRLAWDFLVRHRAAIESMLDIVLRAEVPAGIASLNSDPAILSEIDAYAATAGEGARGNFEAAKAAVRLSIAAAARMDDVDAWLAAQR